MTSQDHWIATFWLKQPRGEYLIDAGSDIFHVAGAGFYKAGLHAAQVKKQPMNSAAQFSGLGCNNSPLSIHL